MIATYSESTPGRWSGVFFSWWSARINLRKVRGLRESKIAFASSTSVMRLTQIDTNPTLGSGNTAQAALDKELLAILYADNTAIIPDQPRGGPPVKITEEERMRFDALRRFIAILAREMGNHRFALCSSRDRADQLLAVWLAEVGPGAELISIDARDLFRII